MAYFFQIGELRESTEFYEIKTEYFPGSKLPVSGQKPSRPVDDGSY